MNNKNLAIVLILIMAISSLSLLMVKPAFAQPIPKPQVPEFTIEYVNHSYTIPAITTSTTDPYTGKTITTTTPSRYFENVTLDITIKNQPFPTTINGNASNLYYNVQTKGYFGGNWTQVITNSQAQSNSDYTVLSIPAGAYPVGGQVDIQVEAAIGYYGYVLHFPSSGSHMAFPYYEFIGQTSDWSPTQTFIMPAPTPTSSVPEFPLLVVLSLFLSTLTTAIILKLRKQRIPQNIL